MENYESVYMVKPEVLVYQIPPKATNRDHVAADWNLANPAWTGRLKVVGIKETVVLRLETEDGELYAECPIEGWPSIAMQTVSDSSRYFVIRLLDKASGHAAFIGMGFRERTDAFDLNVTIQDHFKHIEHLKNPKPTENVDLNLQFKEGESIKINLPSKSEGGGVARPRPKPSGGAAAAVFLPPPPSAGSRVQRQGAPTISKPSSQPSASSTTPSNNNNDVVNLLDL